MKTLPVTLNFNDQYVVGSLTLDDEQIELLKVMPEQCITFSFAGKNTMNPETLEPIDEWTVVGATIIANHLLPRGKYKDIKNLPPSERHKL